MELKFFQSTTNRWKSRSYEFYTATKLLHPKTQEIYIYICQQVRGDMLHKTVDKYYSTENKVEIKAF